MPKKDNAVYFHFSNPIKPEELEKAYSNGLIRKEDLKDGCYYLGKCRNASVAIWNAKNSVFIYLRHKWVDDFLEDIRHPADDDGHDLFTPTQKLTKNDARVLPLKQFLKQNTRFMKALEDLENAKKS